MSRTSGDIGGALGVVIPTLDEAVALPLLVSDLRRLDASPEIVVADGGSADGTRSIARALGVRVIHCDQGRATQMNEGARTLHTPWLLFLHADSRLPAPTLAALESWLAHAPREGAAHFGFRVAAEGSWWRVIEWGQRVRERMTGLAYGDQGLLLSRERYEALGGIPELPLMEDVEAVRRLRRDGGIDRIDAPVVTSARRYRGEGPLHAWLRNVGLISLYSLGVPPQRLARWYRPRRWVGRAAARPAS